MPEPARPPLRLFPHSHHQILSRFGQLSRKGTNVGPHGPGRTRFGLHGAILHVEARERTRGVVTDAHRPRPVGAKTMSDYAEQSGTDPSSLPLLEDIDVLQLGVGSMARCVVIRHVLHRDALSLCQANHSVSTRLL